MADDGSVLARLRELSPALFLLGAVIFAGNVVILAYDVATGAELRLPLGQAFVGAAWAAGNVGLLGLYSELVERKRWLTRAAAVCAVIGAVGYGVMGVVSLALFADLVAGSLDSLAQFFLPPVLVGTALSFPLFAIASLWTGVHSRPVGVLLFAPPAIFVANVASGPAPETILVVVVALALVWGTIGYLLRNEVSPTGRAEPAPGATGGDD